MIETAAIVGEEFAASGYYGDAERYMDQQWIQLIWPIIGGSDFSTTLELAPGHGRNTAKLLPLATRIYAVDINQTNVDFLRRRFEGAKNIEAIRNDGAGLDAIENASITFVYSFDSMVHFDSDVVRSYIKEFRRVMKPGARAFIHYSSYDKNPAGTFRDHPGWRNFMSRAFFHHWLAKEGFAILKSVYVTNNIDLTDDPENADAVTYFELPGDAKASVAERPNVAEPTNSEVRERIREIESSASWRWTAPMRRIRRAFHKLLERAFRIAMRNAAMRRIRDALRK